MSKKAELMENKIAIIILLIIFLVVMLSVYAISSGKAGTILNSIFF